MININDIFNSLGVPKETYVSQEDGKFEKQLIQGVKERGSLCLITGSSKTGKTTLYKNVLMTLDRIPLIVRCDSALSSDEFWKRPLESVKLDQLKAVHYVNNTQTQVSTKIGGKIGWQWLAGLIGEVTLGISSNTSETAIREKIIAKPSPHHLIPLLKNSNAILVVEDFHYLNPTVQTEIFQQWKSFTDNEVSVIVVGTSHHGVDLAYANPDLVGRIQQIDLKSWSSKDLISIAQKGLAGLSITFPEKTIESISKECAGLPIIMQQCCAQLFLDKNIDTIGIMQKICFKEADAWSALNHVAVNRYKQFESWYKRITVGPRKNSRKYNTYELILTIFTLDPPEFSLLRHEIDERLKKLPLKPGSYPPAASINSTLVALEKFQKTNGFQLLEWSDRDQAIYILEPAFLFYLRWREKRKSAPEIYEILRQLINLFTSK